MAVKTSWSAGDVLAAADLTDTFAAKLASADYKPGLVLITAQSFSAASALSLSSVFNSTYDHYFLILHNAASTASILRIRLRDASGDLTGANYSFGSAGIAPTTGTMNVGANGATSWALGYSSTLRTSCALNIIGPNLAQNTQITGTSQVVNSADSEYVPAVIGGVYNAATICTGISIYPSSGTFTGAAALYGYRKA